MDWIRISQAIESKKVMFAKAAAANRKTSPQDADPQRPERDRVEPELDPQRPERDQV